MKDWKDRPILPEAPSFQEYMKYVEAVAATKRKGVNRKAPTTIQQPSTTAILNRPKSEDAKAKDRTVDYYKATVNAAAIKAGDYKTAVAERPITLTEAFIYHHAQHRADRNDVGQVELPEHSVKKEAAVEAFLAAPGTGKTYVELPASEKKRVRNYFLSWLSAAVEKVKELVKV